MGICCGLSRENHQHLSTHSAMTVVLSTFILLYFFSFYLGIEVLTLVVMSFSMHIKLAQDISCLFLTHFFPLNANPLHLRPAIHFKWPLCSVNILCHWYLGYLFMTSFVFCFGVQQCRVIADAFSVFRILHVFSVINY